MPVSPNASIPTKLLTLPCSTNLSANRINRPAAVGCSMASIFTRVTLRMVTASTCARRRQFPRAFLLILLVFVLAVASTIFCPG